MPDSSTLLRRACRLWGLQPSYTNSQGQTTWSSAKTLVYFLEILSGCEIRSDEDLEQIILKKHQEIKTQILSSVHVAWGGQSPLLTLWGDFQSQVLFGEFQFEDGRFVEAQLQIVFQNSSKTQLRWLNSLPLGYHDLSLKTSYKDLRTFVIAPPERLSSPKDLIHSWGPFLPIYALRSQSDLGAGSLRELSMAASELKNYGARWAGTLPLLAGNFDQPDCDPSPYSSLTRLFWNDFYLDLESSLAFHRSEKAYKVFSSDAFGFETQTLKELPFADYHRVYQNKKKVFGALCEDFVQRNGFEQEPFKKYQKENPEIEEFAAFRGHSTSEQNYHRFVQFEMDRQLTQLKKNVGMGLYLDFPVGVNDSGFDFKKFRSVFLAEASVGAPPEQVFRLGQDWGFPPFHPENLRLSRYEYFRKALKHHLKFASILRLDHVMGLFRIYCVPKNTPATEGAYLRFPPEELFAVAILEAHRAGADFVGENLGTVPQAVDQLMQERGIKGMWVAQMKMEEGASDKWTSGVSADTMTCFNTHDMPMFSAFTQGTDLDLVEKIGILTPELRESFKKQRMAVMNDWQEKKNPLFESLLTDVLKSKARYFVCNMEDFWQEDRPQNIPGTYREYPNWRKKFSLRIEDWSQHPQTRSRLDLLKKYRG